MAMGSHPVEDRDQLGVSRQYVEKVVRNPEVAGDKGQSVLCDATRLRLLALSLVPDDKLSVATSAHVRRFSEIPEKPYDLRQTEATSYVSPPSN
jgi:hypothetical protein